MSKAAFGAGALCGALVGACSILLTAVAHGAAGGDLPTGAGLAMLAVVCATVGAIVGAGHRRPGVLGLVAALSVGQVLGHLTLVATSGHHSEHALMPSAPMLAAHAVAAVVLGLMICLAAHLYVVCASVLCWLSLVLLDRSQPPSQQPRRPRPIAVRSVLIRSGLRMRAPPHLVLLGG